MTKAVRIENADMSDHRVVVFVEYRSPDGTWHRAEERFELDHPTSMASTLVYTGRRLVVEEVPK